MTALTRQTRQVDALAAVLYELDLQHIAVGDVTSLEVTVEQRGRARFKVAYIDPQYKTLDQITLVRPVMVDEQSERAS